MSVEEEVSGIGVEVKVLNKGILKVDVMVALQYVGYLIDIWFLAEVWQYSEEFIDKFYKGGLW